MASLTDVLAATLSTGEAHACTHIPRNSPQCTVADKATREAATKWLDEAKQGDLVRVRACPCDCGQLMRARECL